MPARPAHTSGTLAPHPSPSTDGARVDVARYAFVIGTAYLAVYVAMQLGLLGPAVGSAAAPFVNPLAYLPFAVITAITMWDASRRHALDPAARRAYRLLALTFGCEATQVTSQVVSALAGWRPMVDTSAQALSLSIDALRYGFTFAAILAFRHVGRRDLDRTALLLDTATVGIAAAVLGWHLELRGLAAETNATAWRSLFTLAYPVASMATMFGFAVLLLQRPSPRVVGPLRIIALGMLVNVVTDAVYMRMLARGSAPNTGAIFIVYGAIDWLDALAAFVQTRIAARSAARPERSPRERRRDAEGRGPREWPSPLPYLAAAAVFGVLLVEAYQVETHGSVILAFHRAASSGGGTPLAALVIGAIAITAVVMARQIAVQRHNGALVAERLERDAHFRALVQHASDVVLVLDAGLVVREASPAVARVLGARPEAVVGRPLVELVAAEDVALAGADLAQVAADAGPGDGAGGAPCEWRMRHADGGTRWLEVISTNLLHDPAVRGIVVNGRDVSERKALEVELMHQAFHDSLTGLLNRARFGSAVEHALGRLPMVDAERAGIAVLYVDLDDFKPVNDALGHAAGDRVLEVVAERLRDATRGSDAVARLGGDEFAILLERVRGAEEVAIVAERVVRMVAAPIAVDGACVTVGASVGHAHVRHGDPLPSAESLLRAADRAMYEAKAAGGRCHSGAPVAS